MARSVPIKEAGREFDIAFWQAQTSGARTQAAWKLVENYVIHHGRAAELRLQRSVTCFKRIKR
jgi:hypothetical protein